MPALPSGVIALWSGAIVDIPGGFVLCDGTLGTPDLRDQFIVGAGLTYAVGANGGTTQHTHTFTGDGHQHQLPVGPNIQTGANINQTTQLRSAVGTTDNTNHLPPYYALAYIMKT